MENDAYTTISMSLNRELADKLDALAARRKVGREAILLSAFREHAETHLYAGRLAAAERIIGRVIR